MPSTDESTTKRPSHSRFGIAAEVPGRLRRLRDELGRLDIGVLVCLSPANQTYLTGFRALLYSRPIMTVVDHETTTLIVPGLEEAHARSYAHADAVRVYYEHPEGEGPSSHLDVLAEVLAAANGKVGIEFGACPTGLAEHIAAGGQALVDCEPLLIRMREVKDKAELAAITAAGSVLKAAVRASVEACRAGASESEVDGAGNTTALAEAAALDGAVVVDFLGMTPSGTVRTVLPHVHSTTRRLEDGDVVIHTRQVGLDGYRAELERTLFVGRPTHEQARVFDVMQTAQDRAIAAVRPGAVCRDVDRAAREVFADAGLGRYAVHRTGHGIGLAPHESPYLHFENPTRLEEGMVVTIEPGVYIPGTGGFRHSDTVLVTASGTEDLTSFPTDRESLTNLEESAIELPDNSVVAATEPGRP